MPQFVENVEEIRQRAIQKIEDGAVTSAYGVDKDRAINVLNEALATEIVCVLRYMHHYFMATGVHGRSVADEFKEHADAEREHSDKIAERIQQLGGKPDFNPKTLLERSVAQYVEGETLADMIREDLIAERIVIDVYTQMIRFFGNNDPTTRHMIEEILEDEEEHASDLSDMLYIVDPRTGATEGQDPGTRPLNLQSEQAQRGGQKQREAKPRAEPKRNERARGSNVDEREALQALEQMRSREGGEQRQRPASEQKGARAGEQTPEMGGARAPRRQGRGQPEITSESRPARATGSQAPQAQQSSTPPAHQPGASGRPTRQRGQQKMETERDEEVDLGGRGGQGGATRSVHVTKPNRKKRAA